MHPATLLLRTLAFAIMFMAGLAQAEQSETLGPYTIHYNAFDSTFLQPEVAKQYGLVRSRSLGLINISVLMEQEDGSQKAVSANIDGIAKNIIQQVQHIDFRRIQEGDAIYYIGDFRHTNDELLTFELEVQPDLSQPPARIRFSQQFYHDS